MGLWYRRTVRDTKKGSNGRRVRVRIIHGLNISHKELTYLLKKFISYQNKVLHACYANYMIMQSNMTMMVRVIIKRNGGSCMEIYLGMAMEMP